jgi:hypothetical protein
MLSWFFSLSPNSIASWEQLECKLHDHFYSPDDDFKLSDLTSVKQGRDELVNDYIRRSRYAKNWCFNLIVGEKDLNDFDFNDLCSYIRAKLDGQTFITLTQLQQKRKKAPVPEQPSDQSTILVWLVWVLAEPHI